MAEPLPLLLERTAAILADSARLLLQIEDSIAPLLTHPSSARAASARTSIASLQKIDLLSQQLEDLSFWLDDLSAALVGKVAEAELASTAMTRLRLADLRLRLSGEIQGAAEPVSSEAMLF